MNGSSPLNSEEEKNTKKLCNQDQFFKDCTASVELSAEAFYMLSLSAFQHNPGI